jgi:serine/threonine protein kinase
MEAIDGRIVFTRQRLLSSSPRTQVIRCNYSIPNGRPRGRKPAAPLPECVLKVFPSRFRISYDKEIATYTRLVGSDSTVQYPKPLGYGQWTTEKYAKTIAQGIRSTLTYGDNSTIFVLMLEFVEATSLSSMRVSEEIAMAALSSLAALHSVGIVHGDISTTNIFLVGDETSPEIVWMDFSSSWTEASPNQISWEMERAREYFAIWVWCVIHDSADNVGRCG